MLFFYVKPSFKYVKLKSCFKFCYVFLIKFIPIFYLISTTGVIVFFLAYELLTKPMQALNKLLNKLIFL